MKYFIIACCLFAPLFQFAQEYSYRTIEFNVQDGNDLRSLTYKNLRLYPIRAKAELKEQTKQFSRYTPLKQAMEAREIKISEKQNNREGAEVNTLYVENMSSDTIYLMAGEVVQGGNQDRVIGQDMILVPKGGKKKLPVYCVEHGRWSSNGSGNDFKSYYSVSGLSVRKAIEVDKDQSKVWEKVADGNQKNKVNSSTGAYTALASASDYKRQEQEYFDKFFPNLHASKDLVGVIVCTGDKVIGCEIFATEQMFRDASANLLGSYIHEAVTNGKTVTVAPATVKKYMDDILINQPEQERKVSAKGKIFKENGKKLHLTAYE